MRKKAGISVIIPIYKDIKLTKECVSRCLPSIVSEGGRLILINDASPELGMQEMLEDIRSKHPQTIKIITNPNNQGFTSSVNTGLKIAKGDDVVLLNSDVLTPRNWLQTLLREASANRYAGTITPLSNNSTITSLPIRNTGSNFLLSWDVDQINDSLSFDLPPVTAPTGIGFCMFISSRCLARVGILDVASFGKGYGEESDFCQRALKRGFLNLLTPNLYCHHVGSVSFGSSAAERMKIAYNTIHRLHQNYHEDVSSWVQRNPLGPARILRNLQIAKAIGLPIVLHVTHSIGGGVAKHIQSLVEETSDKAFHVVLHGRKNKEDQLVLTFGKPVLGVYEEVFLDDDRDALNLLNSIGVDCIHIHHLVGVPPKIAHWIQAANQAPYIITFHDYYLINGNPFLVNSAGEFAGLESKWVDSPFGGICSHPYDRDKWPSESAQLIAKSACNIFPSRSTLSLFSQAFLKLPNIQVVPHDNIDNRYINDHRNSNAQAHAYQVVTIGTLTLEKGANFLERIAQAATEIKDIHLEFKLIGFAYKELSNVKQLGPYKEEDLKSLIQNTAPDCILFTSRYPEVYSYTLSTAIISGLPIVAPKIGAFEERLTNYPQHLLYDINASPSELARLIYRFLQCSRSSRMSPAPQKVNYFYRSFYLDFLQECKKGASTIFADKVYLTIAGQLTNAANDNGQTQRTRLLTVAMRVYQNPILSLPIKLLPFKLIRMVKEYIYPWPIKASEQQLTKT